MIYQTFVRARMRAVAFSSLQDDAQALIASHVSAFLTIVTGQPEASVPEAQQILDVAHVSTSIKIKVSYFVWNRIVFFSVERTSSHLKPSCN